MQLVTAFAGIKNNLRRELMNKIKTAIRVTEVGGLTDTLVRNFKASERATEDPFLVETMEELDRLNALITSAILQDKTLSTLDEADGKRDETIRTLGAVLAGCVAIPIPGRRELAAPLKAVFDKYAKAGITAASYTSKSSMIESLLEDLGAEDLAEGIAKFEGVAEAISQVREAQDEFNATSDAYVKATASKSAPASTYKRPIVTLINGRLVPYLDAMVIAGKESYEDFAKSVEAEINRLNDAIAKRKRVASGEFDTDEVLMEEQ